MPSLTSLKKLKLCELTYRSLGRLEIETVEDLTTLILRTTEKEIIEQRYMGEDRWEEISKALHLFLPLNRRVI